MDYEKVYKEALERAKKMLASKRSVIVEKQALETIFPELAESEDERIRKRLLNLFKGCPWDSIDDGMLKRDDIINWLEKQGEQKHLEKPIDPDYVDLGLPSGTKWATCNIGATKPERYGDYFAWGEVTTKAVYSWKTYKHADGNYNQLTKYCDDKTCGKRHFTDSKYTLEPEDDAAYVNLGSKWKIPTNDQLDELRNHCYWVWVEDYNDSGMSGYIVYKAKNSSEKGVKVYEDETPSISYSLRDPHIFLPAAGYYHNDYDLSCAGYQGNYWLSEHPDHLGYANNLEIGPDHAVRSSNRRCDGYTIRPVLNQES